jgi:hypothetical protein
MREEKWCEAKKKKEEEEKKKKKTVVTMMTTKALNKRQWVGSMEDTDQNEKKRRIKAPLTSKTATASDDELDIIIEEGPSRAKRGP